MTVEPDHDAGEADHRADRKVELAGDDQQRHGGGDDAELGRERQERHRALQRVERAGAGQQGEDDERSRSGRRRRPASGRRSSRVSQSASRRGARRRRAACATSCCVAACAECASRSIGGHRLASGRISLRSTAEPGASGPPPVAARASADALLGERQDRLRLLRRVDEERTGVGRLFGHEAVRRVLHQVDRPAGSPSGTAARPCRSPSRRR